MKVGGGFLFINEVHPFLITCSISSNCKVELKYILIKHLKLFSLLEQFTIDYN